METAIITTSTCPAGQEERTLRLTADLPAQCASSSSHPLTNLGPSRWYKYTPTSTTASPRDVPNAPLHAVSHRHRGTFAHFHQFAHRPSLHFSCCSCLHSPTPPPPPVSCITCHPTESLCLVFVLLLNPFPAHRARSSIPHLQVLRESEISGSR